MTFIFSFSINNFNLLFLNQTDFSQRSIIIRLVKNIFCIKP